MQNRFFKLLCMAMILAAVAGCGKKDVPAEVPPLVKSQQVSLSNLADTAVYAGSVHGRHETNMSFQVGGQILRRNVQLGDRVRAGDTLMIIDAKDVVQQANQGDAQVEAARAQLSLAQANLARYSELYNEQAIAAAVMDQYQTTYDAAFASYQQALAQAAQGHNALSYTNLVAGADGVVSAVTAEAGQVVTAGQTVLTLVQTDELEVEIHIPENHMQDMPIGRPVQVSFWALGNIGIDGVVREVSPMADATARTYKVRISLPKPPQELALGMTASVASSGTNAGAVQNLVVLPLSSVYQTGEDPQVWTVGDDNTVSLKNVQVEAFGDNQVKVRGLADGDIVVTAGVHRLREGQEVRLAEGQRS